MLKQKDLKSWVGRETGYSKIAKNKLEFNGFIF